MFHNYLFHNYLNQLNLNYYTYISLPPSLSSPEPESSFECTGTGYQVANVGLGSLVVYFLCEHLNTETPTILALDPKFGLSAFRFMCHTLDSF